MFSRWRGLTLQTSGQGCLQAQAGQLGGCWGLWATGASPLVPLLGHTPQLYTCSTLLCLPWGQAQHPQPCPTQGKAPCYHLPLAANTLLSTGCSGRRTGLVPALRFPCRALPANPSPLISLHHPAHVPPAQCSGPNSHPALSLPSITHSLCV